MAHLWQQPYVNVFKHFQIQTWKRSSKEGEVEAVMDKILKATVYRISGAIPAANYINLPHTSTQSLGLTGRYFYLLFKPTPGKYFNVHIDVATQDGLVIRMSFSNLFREFKLTSTWLQFPFICHASSSSVSGAAGLTSRDQYGPAPITTNWTVLCLDLQQILATYLNRRYAYLKTIRLCANMSVRNVFTSDTLYQPGITLDRAKKSGNRGAELASGAAPMPREMAFPLASSENWSDLYDFIRFPTDAALAQFKPFDSVQMTNNRYANSAGSQRMDGKMVFVDRSLHASTSAIDQATQRRLPGSSGATVVQELPSVGVDENGDVQVIRDDVGDIHIYARPEDKVLLHQQQQTNGSLASVIKLPVTLPARKESCQSLKPDPILKLRRIVGFGGATMRDVLWNVTGSLIVYPCHAVVVAMQANNGQQKFFVGHTDKVSCICMNGQTTLLASGQTGTQSVVRIWKIHSVECLAMFKTHSHSLSCLSMSHNGGTLCGVGRDTQGKNMVVIWNTSQVLKGGQVSVLAKAHTEVDIVRMKIAAFDDTRMISCGRDNIRLWRIKDGALRSAPVNLGDYHSMEFTDCCFEAGYEPNKDPLDRIVYACSKSGHIFEVDMSKVVVRHVRRLHTVSDVIRTTNKTSKQKQTISVNNAVSVQSMCINESFCVTGSDDGYLRVWPLDFKQVLLEAQHDGPVTGVNISNDCMRVLAATCTGNVGILDISTRVYTTVMRSHTGRILWAAIDTRRRHLATVSEDHTIRIWDLETLQQLFDFTAPQECPCVIAYHPSQQAFACGFESGALRVFNIESTTMIAELKQHRGKITGLLYNPTMKLLYSCNSVGSLALHDTGDNKYQLMRLLGNTVARGDSRGAQALAISDDGRQLAFVGPTDLTVSVVDAKTLDEVMRIDITSLNTVDNSRTVIDSAVLVRYSPSSVRQILVSTSANKLLKFDAKNGRILSEVDNIHRSGCSGIDVSQDGRHLVTVGDKVVKVWDYSMKLDLNFQVFIGHADTISCVTFTPDMSTLLTAGEAIFVWDFLASSIALDRAELDVPEGRKKVKNYYTGNDEDLSFYGADHAGDHLPSASRPLDDVPRKNPPRPAFVEHGDSRAACERVADLSAISRDANEDLLGEDIVSEDQMSERVEPGNVRWNGSAKPGQHRRQSLESDSFLKAEISSNDRQCRQVLLEAGSPAKNNRSKLDAGNRPHRSDAHRRKSDPTMSRHETLKSGLGDVTHSKPAVLKHFCQKNTKHPVAQRRYVAPPNQAGLELNAVIGYNGNGRSNMIWHSDTGFFAYTSGCVIVVEDLQTSRQRLLQGHSEEISTLALQHDYQVLASASGSQGLSVSQICIWELEQLTLKHTLIHHQHDVVCLAYSRDDRFLISVGDYRECSIVVWCTQSYTVLTSTKTALPIHEVHWDPYTVNEFSSVGSNGSLLFWLLDETRSEVSLSVFEAQVPDNLLATHHVGGSRDSTGAVHLTSVEYAGDSVLYVGTSNGQVSAWDTRHNSCFMHWQAASDSSHEIDFLVSRRGRLLTAGSSHTIRLWSVVSVHELKLIAQNARTGTDALSTGVTLEDEMTLDAPVCSVQFDESLELGIVGTTSGTLWYVNWTERASMRLVQGHNSKINALLVYEDKYIVTGSCDGGVRFWSTVNREQAFQFLVVNQACNCLAFSPMLSSTAPKMIGGKQMQALPWLVAGYTGGTVRLFDCNQMEMALKMHPHADSVTAVSFTADGRMIISGSHDGLIAISSRTTGMTVRVINDQKGAPITGIDIQPIQGTDAELAGSQIWLAVSADRRVSIWSADWSRDSCELIDWMTFPAPAFTPDGTIVKAMDDGYFSSVPPCLARFSHEEPDTIVYVGYGLQKHIQFYSLAQGKVVRTIALTDWASTMDISDGLSPLIVVGNNERLVKLVDYYEGSFQDYVGHSDAITLIKFARHSKLLFSVSNSELFLWNVRV